MLTSRLCVVHCLPSAIRLEEFSAPGTFLACAERRSGEVRSEESVAHSMIDTAQTRTVVLRCGKLMNDRRRMPNHFTRDPPSPIGYATEMDLCAPLVRVPNGRSTP